MSTVSLIAGESVERPGTFEVNHAARCRAAAIWAAVGAVAAKEGKRDDLIDGISSAVCARITGTVDGLEFTPIEVQSVLTVGHESERASSSLPQQAHLLAIVFSKLNVATRKAAMRVITEEFAASGEYPEVAEAVEAEVEDFLSGLRQSKKQIVRGAVKVSHLLQQQQVAGDCGAAVAGQ